MHGSLLYRMLPKPQLNLLVNQGLNFWGQTLSLHYDDFHREFIRGKGENLSVFRKRAVSLARNGGAKAKTLPSKPKPNNFAYDLMVNRFMSQ